MAPRQSFGAISFRSLQVLHALVGVVRSPVVPTFLQVLSRVYLLWAVMWAAPASQAQIWAVVCMTSWAAVEVPRYLFYASGIVGTPPYPLFYLRYSLFFVLYPSGITGEIMTILAALPTMKASQESMSMAVGPLKVSVYALTILSLVVYVPGAPYMYLNMVSNRKGAFKKRRAGLAKKKAA